MYCRPRAVQALIRDRADANCRRAGRDRPRVAPLPVHSRDWSCSGSSDATQLGPTDYSDMATGGRLSWSALGRSKESGAFGLGLSPNITDYKRPVQFSDLLTTPFF